MYECTCMDCKQYSMSWVCLDCQKIRDGVKTKMDLNKLFEIQRELDNRIREKHGLQGQDLLPKKILALQVELGELANEQRSWKYWSEDQEPRTKKKCVMCDGLGNDIYYTGSLHEGTLQECAEPCEYCDGMGNDESENPLLEEYVDVLHFMLSIGLQEYEYDKDIRLPIGWIRNHDPIKYENIIKQFKYMFQQIGYFYDCIAENECGSRTEVEEQYEQTFRMFLGLGEMLGFTWEQIEQAYMSKNQINHARQQNGY